MPRPPSKLATVLPAKIINRPPRQYPGKKWIIPLGAKAEATSLKASVSRQRGGNVRKTYTDGIDKVRSRTPSLRRFPRPACRRTGGSAYGRWRDSINFVETPTSQGSCAKKAIFLHRYAFSISAGRTPPADTDAGNCHEQSGAESSNSFYRGEIINIIVNNCYFPYLDSFGNSLFSLLAVSGLGTALRFFIPKEFTSGHESGFPFVSFASFCSNPLLILLCFGLSQNRFYFVLWSSNYE